MRGTRAWSPTGLIPWFSKTEGNTYATLLHHPFLFKGKPTQCSRGSTSVANYLEIPIHENDMELPPAYLDYNAMVRHQFIEE